MKKLITFTIITLLFTSCSSDDNPIIPANDDDKFLTKIVQTTYNKGELDEKIVFTYKNNKPLKILFYNLKDELMGYTDYLYNDKELLAEIKHYLPNGTLQNESLLTYDSKNRIIQRNGSEEEGEYLSVDRFTHNNDNTIIVNSTSGTKNYTKTKTYHINSDGLIYKETIDGETATEVIYDGNNPTSIITKYSTTIFTYDESNLPKGIFLNHSKNIFGENKINPILWGYYLQDQAGSNSDKFNIKSVSSNGDIEESKYTFDGDGYPVKMKSYYNEELKSEIKYFYE